MYVHRLLSLNLLPLMMQLELYDVLFFICCFQNPDTSNAFSILYYVHFYKGITRYSTHQKLTHSLSKSNASLIKREKSPQKYALMRTNTFL